MSLRRNRIAARAWLRLRLLRRPLDEALATLAIASLGPNSGSRSGLRWAALRLEMAVNTFRPLHRGGAEPYVVEMAE